METEPTLYINSEGRDKHGTWNQISPLLSCGHFGPAIIDRSSTWDFPDEPMQCPECKEIRQMDVRLQALIHRSWQVSED